MVNNVIAYALFLVGGFLGWHQLYLGRVNHAVFLSSTFGGFLGITLLRDLYRIPAYVRYANGNLDDVKAEVSKQQILQKSDDPIPSLSVVRLLAEWGFGSFIGILSSSVVNVDELVGEMAALVLGNVLYIPGCAFGVWFIGCIGEQVGSFQQTIVGAAVGCLVDVLLVRTGVTMFMLLFAVVMFNRSREYRIMLNPDARSSCGHVLWKYCLYNGMIFLLFFAALYSHGRLETSDGGVYYFSSSFHTLRNSDFWQEFNSSEFFERTYQGSGHHYFSEAIDIKGKRSSLRILGFNPRSDPSLEEVKTAYRMLAKKYHPDAHVRSSDEERAVAEDMIVQVNLAYEILVEELNKKASKDDDSKSSPRRERRRGRKRRGKHHDDL